MAAIVKKNEKGYLGNPLLKRSGEKIRWTKDRLEEFVKCSQDPLYFINNYYKITTLDHGLINITLRDYQVEFITMVHENRFVISKQARQMGKTDSIAAYICWMIIFKADVQIGIMAHKGAGAREVLSRVQTGYENLPKWLQQGVVTWNKGDIELENGSKVITSASTGGAIRGKTINFLYIDEAAFIPHNIAEQFFTSVYPTISTGKTSKVIITSTPNGMNYFYKMYKNAESKKSEYKFLSIPWHRHPDRDEKWKKQTIANTSEQQFTQEFEIEFIGSNLTLISGSCLATLVTKDPIVLSEGNKLKIYEKPVHTISHQDNVPDIIGEYVLIADVGHGIGKDYSAFSVIRVDKVPYEQVAVYADNTIDPLLYPNIIYNVAKYYHNAKVAIELNDMGIQVANDLINDLEYEHVLKTKKSLRGTVLTEGESRDFKKGITTSKTIKKQGCLNFKSLIENNKMIIHDEDTYFQLFHFIPNGKSFEAEEGFHDDLIMPLVLFGWIQNQTYFKEYYGGNKHARAAMYSKQISMAESSLPPSIFIQPAFVHKDDENKIPITPDKMIDGFYFPD